MRAEFVRYALENLLHRKLRSGLTVLSILIGITAIFALVSFGIGIQSYVDEIAANAGVDKLFLQAKGIGAPGTRSAASRPAGVPGGAFGGGGSEANKSNARNQ